jgi:predicted alpha/beta superfamily hydrolase
MNHIILSSSLFGSIFLFSTSLILTNRALLEDKKVSNGVFIINGLTMLASGSMIVAYNYSVLNSVYFKSSMV